MSTTKAAGSSPRIKYGDSHSRGLLSHRTTEEGILQFWSKTAISAPSTPRGSNDLQSRQRKPESNGTLFSPRPNISLANEDCVKDYESRIMPVCECEALSRSLVLTGVKLPLYLHVLNAQDLYVPVKASDFEISVRAGPGNPSVEIQELASNRLFKLSVVLGTSGIYTLGLLCRRARVRGTPFDVKVVRSVTSPKYSIIRGEEAEMGVAGHLSSFEIIARDQHGNRRLKGGDAIDITMYGNQAVELNRVVDNENGIYEVCYTPKLAGWYDIYAAVNGITLEICPVVLYVQPAEISSKTTCLVNDEAEIKAAAGYETSLLIQARDVLNNGLRKGGAKLSGKLCALEFDHVVELFIEDLGDGTYKASFTGGVQGSYTPKIYVCRENDVLEECCLCSSAEICVVHGDVCPSECTLEANSFASQSGIWPEIEHRAVAGEWVSYTLKTYDAYGNRCQNGEQQIGCLVGIEELPEHFAADFDRELCFNEDAYSIIEKQIETVVKHAGDGSYTIFWKSKYSAKYSTQVLLNSNPIKDSVKYVEIVPALSSPHHSWIGGNNLSESLRGILTLFHVIAADRFGNRRQSGGDHIQVDIAGPTYYTGNFKDNHNGSYTVSYSAKAPGRYSLHVLMNGEAVGGRSYGVRIRDAITRRGLYCISGGVKRITSNHVLALRLYPLSEANNPVPNDKRKFEVHLELRPETAFKVDWLRDRTPQLNPQEVDRLVNDCKGSDTESPLWTRFSDVFGKKYTDDIRKSFACSSISNLGRIHKPEITSEENGYLLVNWKPIISGVFLWRVYCNGEEVSPLNEELIVIPENEIEIYQSVLYGYGAKYGIAGKKNHFILQTSDRNGNAIQTGGADIFATISLCPSYPKKEVKIQRQRLETHVADLGDGRYMICYCGNTAGQYQGRVSVRNSKRFLSCRIVIHPASACGDKFTVLGTKSYLGTVGRWEEFTVESRDKFGNARRFGEGLVSVSLSRKSSSTDSSKIFSKVKDNNDGSYTVSYFLTTAGCYMLCCCWRSNTNDDNESLQTCFYKGELEIKPGRICLEKCIVFGSGLHCCQPQQVATVLIQLRDKFGNHRSLESVNDETDDSDHEFNQKEEGQSMYCARLQGKHNELTAVLYKSSNNAKVPGGSITVNEVSATEYVAKCSEDCTAYQLYYRTYEEGIYYLEIYINGQPLKENPHRIDARVKPAYHSSYTSLNASEYHICFGSTVIFKQGHRKCITDSV